jgi:anti-sigma factor RsiW
MDYLESALPTEVIAALEAHVAGCPRCAAFFASYLATPRILREATQAELPPALQRSLRTWLREQRGRSRGERDA